MFVRRGSVTMEPLKRIVLDEVYQVYKQVFTFFEILQLKSNLTVLYSLWQCSRANSLGSIRNLKPAARLPILCDVNSFQYQFATGVPSLLST